jgi:2-oxoglutarate dehydrogenase E2 component (dihydrolipoamide succinyltransferase)
MTEKIVVPELGESVLDATVARWLKKEGEQVSVGEILVELETDKVNLEISASSSGTLASIERAEGEDVKVGDLLGTIDEAAEGDQPTPQDGDQRPARAEEAQKPAQEVSPEKPPAAGEAPQEEAVPEGETEEARQPEPAEAGERITPVAARMAREQGLDLSSVKGTGPGGRVTRADIEAHLKRPEKEPASPSAEAASERAGQDFTPVQQAGQDGRPVSEEREERVKMSRRRRTIAARLVEAQQTAAMLSTFNEADMSAVMDLRTRRNEEFQERHGVKIGFTSFFVKASIAALKTFPRLNAEIRDDVMVLKHYYDIGIAVGDPEGLVVPVIRNADRLSFAEIERQVKEMAGKAQSGSLSLDDLRGGTFTITNGGVFGSLLSTPILSYPQVGILGLHKIEKRPVAIDDRVVIRPMMYVALTYDHRIVDGREAVQFLVRVKELIEDPEELLLEG